jgi:hypothetical protein
MAGATLISDGARLDGAIVEAAYAFDRPPLLKRLGDDGVLRIVDLQTLRFAGPRYLETAALSRLPYAPPTPISVDNFTGSAAESLARDGLLYAQDRGSDAYLAPTLPLFDLQLDQWLQHAEVIDRPSRSRSPRPGTTGIAHAAPSRSSRRRRLHPAPAPQPSQGQPREARSFCPVRCGHP